MVDNIEALPHQVRVIEIRDAISRLNVSHHDVGVFCKSAEHVIKKLQNLYDENNHLPEPLVIPFGVFEFLLEMLEAQLPDFASSDLLEMLYDLPEGFVTSLLIKEQETRLTQLTHSRLEESPLDSTLRLEAAWSCLDNREWDQAIEHAEVVLTQNPAHSKALQIKSEALSAQGDDHAAFSTLTKWIEVSESAEALFLRSQLLDRHDYRLLARQDLEIVRLDELSLDQQLWCIKFFTSLEEYAEALRRLDTLNGEAGAGALGWFLRGIALHGLDRHEEASRCFERIADEVIEAAELQAEATRWLADTQLALGYGEQALQMYLRLESGIGYHYWVRRGSLRAAHHLIEERTSRRRERDLLLDIIQHSQSTEARQRYADHLISLDDPRGEEIARACTPRCEGLAPLTPSRRSRQRWIERNMDARFQDALPVQVRIINPQQIPLFERLPWTHTVQHLSVHGVDPVNNGPSLAVLCDIELPALRFLEIESKHLSYHHIKKLIRASFFQELLGLSLRSCHLSLPALQLLLQHLPEHLTSLNLAYNNAAPSLPVASKLGEIFSSSSVLQKLQQLDLTDCRVGDQDMKTILSLSLPNLKGLFIASNDLTHIGSEALMQCPWFGHLEALSAGESGIERALLSSVLDEAESLKLKRLKLNGDWSQDDIDSVLAHPGFGSLEVVDLGVPYMSEASWLKFIKAKNPRQR